MKNPYSLDLFETKRSTEIRTDITLMTVDRDEGQALQKFKKIPLAFMVEADGSITLLSNTPIKVRQFGEPFSD